MGPPSTSRCSADRYYYGEQMCSVVWERERKTDIPVDGGISEEAKELKNRLRAMGLVHVWVHGSDAAEVSIDVLAHGTIKV